MMKTRTLTTILFLIVGGFAVAEDEAQAQEQYSYNFTAPAGAIPCSYVRPYQQYYQNLVENSTPPYPGALQPNNFHMPAFPNHPMPFPVGNGGCGVMGGFTGDQTGVPMKVELGNDSTGITGELRINNSAQVVTFNSGSWNVPSPYPLIGQATTFTLNATITQVCNAECQPATGQITLSGDWAFQWSHAVSFRYNTVFKLWTNVSPVTVNGLSTVAILD